MIAHAREQIKKVGTVTGIVLKRLLPAATFFVLFIIIASMVDRGITQNRPATDYLRYYSFDVQNAREGEDVNFTVCRSKDQNFNYNGSLAIYVIPNAAEPSKDAKVFTKDIGGTLRPGSCENKVLLASEFKHTPGKYKMFISVSFREPRYNIEKTTQFSSNVYTIYAQPTELNARIQYLEQQLEQAKQQLQDADAGQDTVGTDLKAPASNQPGGTTTTPAPTQPNIVVQPAPVTVTPATPATPTTREVCTVNLLGIKVGCRQEPI